MAPFWTSRTNIIWLLEMLLCSLLFICSSPFLSFIAVTRIYCSCLKYMWLRRLSSQLSVHMSSHPSVLCWPLHCTVYKGKCQDVFGPAVSVLNQMLTKWFPFLEICVSVRLCSKGGKAQIIGPEEEDEEYDGYAFNEVRRTCGVSSSGSNRPTLIHLSFICCLCIFILFLHCSSYYLFMLYIIITQVHFLSLIFIFEKIQYCYYISQIFLIKKMSLILKLCYILLFLWEI